MGVDGKLWRRMAYAGARYGPRAWVRVSPAAFGLVFCAALPTARRSVRKNLRRVLGPRAAPLETLDVARTFMAYAGCLAESLAGERRDAQQARRRLRDASALRSNLSHPGGMIVVTAHAGAWDAAARLLARDLRRDVLVVMEPEQAEKARELHDAVRQRGGVRVAHVGRHPLDGLTLLKHLREGGVVAIQLDRVPRQGRTIDVDMFGARYPLPAGPFALAGLAGVPILPIFSRRVGFFDYELCGGPLVSVPPRPSPAVLKEAAERVAWELERFLYAHPTQWFHFERRPPE